MAVAAQLCTAVEQQSHNNERRNLLMTGSYMYDRRNVHQCRKGSARVLLSCRCPTRRDGKRRDGRVAIKLCGTRDDGEKHRREEISEARRLLGLPELRNMNNELGDDVTLVSIKRAFRLRVKEIHPDVLQSSDESMRKEQELEIQNVYKAYEILLEVEKRKSEDGENARLQRNGIDVFEVNTRLFIFYLARNFNKIAFILRRVPW